MRLITFSTGNFYSGKEYSINHFINLTKKLKIDGVEIMIISVPFLNKLKISKNNIKYLKSLKHVTIHAPIHDIKNKIYFYNTEKCKKIIKKLNKIYDQINAKNINFHAYQIKNPKLFEQFPNYDYSIENLEAHHKYKISDYQKILKNNPRFKLVLDVTHVCQKSPKLVKNYIKKFKDKITYIHLSAMDKKGNIHRLVHTNQHILRYLKPIKKLKCPVCIETALEDRKLFQKEINFVRKWLNQNY